jgi:hypothetical protein
VSATPRLLVSAGWQTDGLKGLSGGLTKQLLDEGVKGMYRTLDIIDEKLLESGSARLSGIIELANLSSIIGNLLAGVITEKSEKVFSRAGPHKYQDLRAGSAKAQNIEIKVALETNAPKGHLAKEGKYLTARYVLCDTEGKYTSKTRGAVPYIWEMRFGALKIMHFNISNTAGDSGKTAVVNSEGLRQLRIVYFDRDRCPYGARSAYLKGLAAQPALISGVED